MKRKLLVFAILLTNCFLSSSETISPINEYGLQLKEADCLIEHAIDNKSIPGAVLGIVQNGRITYLKAYGHKAIFPKTEPMEVSTIFDLASCTKPIATATSIMILEDQGLIHLNDPVRKYIPGFASGNKEIRIIHLLTHTSGLTAYASETMLLKKYGSNNPNGLMQYISTCKRDFPAGTAMQYSCLNYIALQHIVETVSKQSLRNFAKTHIFNTLGMTHTDFTPEYEMVKRCAPTSRLKGDSTLKGIVHDPLARLMNKGISGNAGLFSDVHDLAILTEMLLHGGSWNGKQILSAQEVKKMTTVPDSLKAFGRTPGWDVSSVYASCKGKLLSPESYCHTGYTGTSIVIDPKHDLAIILLTNRVHPYDKGSVVKLRSELSDLVAKALLRNSHYAAYLPLEH